MRSFSGLYFFLRIPACLCMLLSHLIEQLLYINQRITLGPAILCNTYCCHCQAVLQSLHELLGYCHTL